jgi:hypothetical protein
MAMSGLFRVRTELHNLVAVPFLAHHPVQTNGQSSRHGALAVFLPRRMVRWKYLLRHWGMLRVATWAASTSKKRKIESPTW